MQHTSFSTPPLSPSPNHKPMQNHWSPLPGTASLSANCAQDSAKQYHVEWGVMKDQDFHPLTLKHQHDLESLHCSGSLIADFYFWQANLGGYCMADMIQKTVVSSEGMFALVRRVVEGPAHPGRRKKQSQLAMRSDAHARATMNAPTFPHVPTQTQAQAHDSSPLRHI